MSFIFLCISLDILLNEIASEASSFVEGIFISLGGVRLEICFSISVRTESRGRVSNFDEK